MKTEKLEKQTLTGLVFSANVIVGAMARQMVLNHGLDAFNGYVAFGICIIPELWEEGQGRNRG